jgi:chitin-binding protein
MRKSGIMAFRTYFAFAALPALAALSSVHADGLMELPRARNWYCGFTTKPDEIPNNRAQFPACSTAFAALPMAAYNFMTVVTHTWGRAKTSPLPAHVCSFDAETWKGVQTPWDVPMEWPTSPMSPGIQSIVWNAAWGPHYDDTHDFSYWITKSDFKFSLTKELTWEDFETEPFCTELYDDKNPAANPDVIVDKTAIKFTTKCTVPARSGHHVIYGEWGRNENTLQRFHGCSDVVFGTNPIRPALGGTGRAEAPHRTSDALGRDRRGDRGGAPTREWTIPMRLPE